MSEEFRIFGDCVHCSDGSCPSCQEQLPASKRTVRRRVLSYRTVGLWRWELALDCSHTVRIWSVGAPAIAVARCEACGELVAANADRPLSPDEAVVYAELREQILKLYPRLYPGYVINGLNGAVALMADEILMLRKQMRMANASAPDLEHNR